VNHPFRCPRLVALAAVASALLLTGCGGGSGDEEIAKQVEIAKQAADRAVAAQLAAEAAAKGHSPSASSLAGSGFRHDGGDEAKFGSPTDGSGKAPKDDAPPRSNPGEGGPPPPGSLPPPPEV
jgi:hypothetical protein